MVLCRCYSLFWCTGCATFFTCFPYFKVMVDSVMLPGKRTNCEEDIEEFLFSLKNNNQRLNEVNLLPNLFSISDISFWQLSAWGHSGGYFGVFPNFDNFVSQQQLVWPQGWVFSAYRILLTVKCFSSFGAFPIFNNLSPKQQVLERNIHLNLYVIQFYVVIVWHLVPLGFLFLIRICPEVQC